MGKIYCGSGGDGRTGRYFGGLPSVTAHMVQGQADVGDGAEGEVGEFPDGIHTRIRSPDFPERVRTVPEAQLRSLRGHGVPAQRLPRGAHTLHCVTDVTPAPTDRTSDKDVGGQDIC